MVTAERLTEIQVHSEASRIRPRQKPAVGRQFLRFLAVWSVLMATALFTVAGFARSTVANYRIDALNQAYQTALAQNQELSAQVATLSDPSRLVAQAPSLGMSSPSRTLFVSSPAVATAVTRPAAPTASLSMVTETLGLIIGSLGDAVSGW